MVLSFLFISEVSYADYSSVVVLSFSRNSVTYRFPESDCITVGIEAAKNIGIKEEHRSRGVGIITAGTNNKGSFLQTYCMAKNNLTDTILIIMNSNDKVTRDKLVGRYVKEFRRIMKKRFGIVHYSATGP